MRKNMEDKNTALKVMKRGREKSIFSVPFFCEERRKEGGNLGK